jgi:hypothetical protein
LTLFQFHDCHGTYGSNYDAIGAAIGGIGTEKFRTEDTATKEAVPIYVTLFKESN